MRNRWNQSFVAVLVSFTVGFTGCASMQTTMTNMGNSLAFWKKSAPKDQFASNLTSPSATGTPTGAYGPNSMANNQPSSYPFANTGNRQNGSTPTGFGQGTNVASNTAAGTRSPYNTSYPSTSAPSATSQSQFGTPQPSIGQPAARTASSSSSSFPGSTGSYSPPSSSSGFSGSYGSSSGMNTSTPSAQFQSNNGYQPSSSSFAPTSPSSGSTGFSPTGNSSPAARTATQPTDYPSTPYGKFGSTQSTTSPTTTTPPSSSSFKSNTPYQSTDPTASTSGFNPNASTASTTAPVPSSSINRPPSLPQSVFSKSGGYSPGSTGVSGTATQAGFESMDSTQLYKPNTASKIPTQKSDLYTPGQ